MRKGRESVRRIRGVSAGADFYDLSPQSLARWCDGTWLNGLPAVIREVSHDTRTLQDGDLFIALPGSRYDGHDYLEEAYQRGASGAIVNRTRAGAIRLPLPGDAQPLVLGQVLEGMKPTDKPVVGAYVRKVRGKELRKTPNDPMMPVAWIKTFTGKAGKPARVFATTMGAAVDLKSEGLRRLLVNAAYWCVGMEDKIPPRADVRLVGEYEPSYFGVGKHKRGLKPSDYAM